MVCERHKFTIRHTSKKRLPLFNISKPFLLLLFFNINSRGFEKQERDARDGEVAGLMT
jgi:hypothetical protein